MDLVMKLATEVFVEFFSDIKARQPMWQMMYGGVFDRHPNLKLSMTEVRLDWIPANLAHLDALAAFRPTARMVAVVNDSVSTEELKRMHALGVRGIRFNLAQAGATTPEMMEPLSRRINDLGWHIQINAPAAKILEVMPILERVPSPIVFDHLAHIPQPEGVNHPLYAKVRALMDRGRTWVKLSGAYADTKVGPPTYADSSAVARAYAKAAPERCVWGSDWPHPSEQAKQQLPDDGVLFDLLSDWVPDEKVRHRILVENPATLYDFPKGA